MKKKLLVLLIALASTMMPNLASAIVIIVDVQCIPGDIFGSYICF